MSSGYLSESGRRTPEKIILLGARGVGKTSILRYLINGTFSRTSTQAVGDQDEVTFEYRSGAQAISICVTDTAGRNSEYTLSDSYYREAAGAVLVYSHNSDTSFRRMIVDGYQSVKNRTPEALVFIVGNKEDLNSEVHHHAVEVPVCHVTSCNSRFLQNLWLRLLLATTFQRDINSLCLA